MDKFLPYIIIGTAIYLIAKSESNKVIKPKPGDSSGPQTINGHKAISL